MAYAPSPLIECLTIIGQRLDRTQIIPFYIKHGHLTLVEASKLKPFDQFNYMLNIEFIEMLERKRLDEQIFIAALEASNQLELANDVRKSLSRQNATAGSVTPVAPTAASHYEHNYELLKREQLPELFRQALRKSLIILQNNIQDTTSVIDYMMTNEALSDANAEKLNALKPRHREIVRTLITEILLRSSVHDFVRFMESLDSHAKSAETLQPIQGKVFQLTYTSVIL